MKITKVMTIISVLVSVQSCTSYSTDLNEMQQIKVSQISDIKKGKTCSKNLFGGFSLPYIGDTAIKLSGDQSVVSAIKDGDIREVYAVDRVTHNYLFYSKRCTVVFGKSNTNFTQ